MVFDALWSFFLPTLSFPCLVVRYCFRQCQLMGTGLNGTRGLNAALLVAEEYSNGPGTVVIRFHNMADRNVAETRQKQDRVLTGCVQVRLAYCWLIFVFSTWCIMLVEFISFLFLSLLSFVFESDIDIYAAVLYMPTSSKLALFPSPIYHNT